MKKLDPFIFILVKYKNSKKITLWSRMFIQTEETPNPLTLKFLPGQVVMLEGTRFFEDLKQSRVSPLAEDLFMLEGVDAVLLGSDFVSVTKKPDVSWETLRPFVFTALMEHFLSNRPLFREE
ncbi:MAG: NifU N-terminal domain-containing protein, partial [Holosporales bacterium]